LRPRNHFKYSAGVPDDTPARDAQPPVVLYLADGTTKELTEHSPTETSTPEPPSRIRRRSTITSWPVVGGLSSLLGGFGANALYGDHYVLAEAFFFCAILLATGKYIAAFTPQTGDRIDKAIIAGPAVLVATIAFAGSILWTQAREAQQRGAVVVTPARLTLHTGSSSNHTTVSVTNTTKHVAYSIYWKVVAERADVRPEHVKIVSLEHDDSAPRVSGLTRDGKIKMEHDSDLLNFEVNGSHGLNGAMVRIYQLQPGQTRHFDVFGTGFGDYMGHTAVLTHDDTPAHVEVSESGFAFPGKLPNDPEISTVNFAEAVAVSSVEGKRMTFTDPTPTPARYLVLKEPYRGTDTP
jgi:hypothetical protein